LVLLSGIIVCVIEPCRWKICGEIRSRLHGEFSTPGLNSVLHVNRVEIFCDYMDDFNLGSETLCYTFSASMKQGWNFNPGVELSPTSKILSCNRAFDFDRVLYYRHAGLKFQPGKHGWVQPRGWKCFMYRPLSEDKIAI
jgi:hypothetical protein